MKLKELLEMSMIIPPSLSMTDDEKKGQYGIFLHTLQTTDKYSKIYDVAPDIELYFGSTNKNNIDNNYIAINNKTKQVIYSMEYDISYNDVLKQYVNQTWVWSDPQNPTNLPTKLFFTLIDKFNTIVCDEQQTQLGRDFWIKQMNMAFEYNFNVYFFNFTNKLLVKLINSSDIEKINNIYKVWNATESAKSKVFVISKLDL